MIVLLETDFDWQIRWNSVAVVFFKYFLFILVPKYYHYHYRCIDNLQQCSTLSTRMNMCPLTGISSSENVQTNYKTLGYRVNEFETSWSLKFLLFMSIPFYCLLKYYITANFICFFDFIINFIHRKKQQNKRRKSKMKWTSCLNLLLHRKCQQVCMHFRRQSKNILECSESRVN